MHISLIWAMTRNRAIGVDGGLPWRLPNEMKHFTDTTMGKPVIMGRKTFVSMQTPLPGRLNIVLTRDHNWSPGVENVVVVHDLTAGLAVAKTDADQGVGEVMIIGGAQIYALALPQATRLYMTCVHADIAGDTLFPEFDLDEWREVSSIRHEADARHSAAFTIKTLERARA